MGAWLIWFLGLFVVCSRGLGGDGQDLEQVGVDGPKIAIGSIEVLYSELGIPTNGANPSALTIPSEIGELKDVLVELMLTDFAGQVPDEIGELTLLESLVLATNQESMDRTIPESIGRLTNMKSLSLFEPLSLPNNGRFVVGTLPSSIGKLTALTSFSVNQLEGQIPSEIGELTGISSLHLDNAWFPSYYNGTIPSTIGQLTLLSSLIVGGGGTKLTGTIPSEVGRLTKLTLLDLRDGELEGPIPADLRELSDLDTLFLRGNRLTELPSAILSDLTKLKRVEIQRNLHLRGTIPAGISALSSLSHLDVSYNSLFGSVPRSIGMLSNLVTLDVSYNNISHIPVEITKLKQLRNIGVSSNNLKCDCETTEWYKYLVNNKDRIKYDNIGNAICANWNGWGGFSISSVTKLDDQPCAIPENLRSLATHDLMHVQWDFLTEENIPNDPEMVWDCSDTIGKSPSNGILAFRVDFQEVGTQTVRSICTWNTFVKITELTPFTWFEVTVVPMYVRYDRVRGECTGCRRLAASIVFLPTFCPGFRSGIMIAGTDEWIPGVPKNLRIPSLRAVEENQVSVGWDAPSRPNGIITNYEIRIEDNNGLSPPRSSLELSAAATIMSLLPAHTYTVYVRAYTSVGPGNWTEGFMFATASECDLGHERATDSLLYECLPCPNGYFRDESRKRCEKCSESFPETLNEGSTSEDDCVTPYGWFTIDSAMRMNCEDPQFAGKVECKEKGVRLETLPINQGFWRIANRSIDIRECRPESFCKPIRSLGGDEEGDDDEASQGKRRRRMLQDNSNNTGYCSPHHSGILCTKCDPGYAVKEGQCVECTDQLESKDQALLIFWSVLLAMLVFIGVPVTLIVFAHRRYSTYMETVHATSQRSVNGHHHHQQQQQPQNESNISCWTSFKSSATECFDRHKLHMKETAVFLRILLGFFQVYLQFGKISGILEADGSNGLALVTGFNVAVIFQALDIGCARIWNFFDTLLIYTLMPFLVLGVGAIPLIVYKFTRRPQLPFLIGSFVWFAMQLCFLVYPGISSTVLATFVYEEFPHDLNDDNPYYGLQAEPNIDFDSNKSKQWRIYAWFMALVYPIGIVVLFVSMTLYYQRHVNKNKQHNGKEKTCSEEKAKIQDAVVHAVSFLVLPYTYPWFESYELLRKLLLTSGFLLIHQASPSVADIIFVVLAYLFTIVLKHFRPYKNELQQIFAEVSIVMISILGFIGLANKYVAKVSTEAARGMLYTCATLEVIIFVVLVAWNVRRGLKQRDFDPSDLDQPEESASLLEEGNNQIQNQNQIIQEPTSFHLLKHSEQQQNQNQVILGEDSFQVSVEKDDDKSSHLKGHKTRSERELQMIRDLINAESENRFDDLSRIQEEFLQEDEKRISSKQEQQMKDLSLT